jgi:hypothetical protein
MLELSQMDGNLQLHLGMPKRPFPSPPPLPMLSSSTVVVVMGSSSLFAHYIVDFRRPLTLE